ncbi:MAG: efflux RND transporter periplasmic adaptor subunit [candidate division WS1 bacterium]|nr:efflux RND transporter periplasmic adaptor subunit [candidate division WS1 bacterium]
MNRCRPLTLTLTVALLAVGLSGCGRGQKTPAAVSEVTPVLVETARLGAMQEVITLTGTAQADQDSTLNPEVPGNIAAVYVRVGDRVRAGQALVRLDSALATAQEQQSAALVRSAQARLTQAGVGVRLTDESTRSAVRQAEVGLEAAKQQLAKAQKGYELTRAQIENAIQQAQLAVTTAQTSLDDIRAGARSQEIAQAQAQVDAAAVGARLSGSNYQRYLQLHQEGAVSAQALDAARADNEAAEARLEQAKQALSLAHAGARTGQIQVAELAVQQARQQLQLAESRRDQIYVAQRDVNAAESAVQQAREQLHLTQQQRRQLQIQQQEEKAAAAAVGQARAGRSLTSTTLHKHMIRAPFGGVVAERFVDPGGGAGTATPLLRVVSMQPMKVETEVSELEIARLRVGMVAEVTVDGLPGRTFHARVARISPASRAGQRIYVAELAVDNKQELIRPGMFCRASIVLQTIPNAVIVSRDTLVESGEVKQVYAVENNKIAIREVTIGAQNGGEVQLLSGVSPGDKLVRSGQTLLAKGQDVKPTEEGEIAQAGAPASDMTSNGAVP